MYQLSVLNITPEALLVTIPGSEPCEAVSISPSRSSTFKSSSWSKISTLKLDSSPATEKQILAIDSSLTLPRRSSPSKSAWECVECDSTLPWTIYRLKSPPNQHQLIVFPKRSLSSFLADMPSSLPLSSLLLPGTHESVAFHGWPISQCQDPATPLATQLISGIRALDIRLSIINGALISYHGIYPQRLPFLEILQTVHTFLSSSEGKTETIIMSIKQEDKASLLFSQLVHSAVYDGPGGRQMWFLENRIPTLGEVRGKVVMFSRFGGNGEGWEGGLEGLGVHPTTWPDSQASGFEWWLKETKIRTHDWYSISSFIAIPEKAVKSSQILLQTETPSLSPILSITFLSAASFPLALPPVVACGFGWPAWGMGIEGVNSRVGKWILSLLAESSSAEKLSSCTNWNIKMTRKPRAILAGATQSGEARLRGWCFMDYYRDPVDVGLVRLLIECNYRGRKVGEEGWV